jgi:CRISPR/Cas system-associated exonuclease Cas4 (RecB family)
MPYSPAQQQVIDLLGTAGSEVPAFPTHLAAELREHLEAELVAVVAALPEGESLWVAKHDLATIHGCEAHHVASTGSFSWSVPTVRGAVAHKAIELSVHWRGEPYPAELVDEAIARLIEDERGPAQFLGAHVASDLAQLRGEAGDLVAKFLECFPPLRKQWTPVTESKVRADLLDGRVVLSGKVDLTLGSARAGESRKVIIDLKSGSPVVVHRDDLRFYALVETLRLGVPPRRVATYYLDSARAQPEDVTPALLHAAALRVVAGVRKMVELQQAVRPPEVRPGGSCRWCPVLETCEAGQAHLAAAPDW